MAVSYILLVIKEAKNHFRFYCQGGCSNKNGVYSCNVVFIRFIYLLLTTHYFAHCDTTLFILYCDKGA